MFDNIFFTVGSLLMAALLSLPHPELIKPHIVCAARSAIKGRENKQRGVSGAYAKPKG